ncbi:MAG: sugar phosphate nucleotidyltransferase [Candidatus Pacebacteria bacterium]|nr:sugar phosphate nucleotidyltransferase [Candidatus Paceibacterota bacterium]
MKAVILAAGSGVRFQPISITRPKPIFSVFGKSILEYNLDELAGLVDGVIIIVGHLGEKIKNLIGEDYKGMKISYLVDSSINGTGTAAKLALEHIDDKFLLLNGDDIYYREDIKKTLKQFPCLMVKEHPNASRFGVVSVEENRVSEIVEKPENPQSNFINTGLYFLPKTIFNYEIKKSSRGEYEFTDYIKQFLKENKLYYSVAEFWFPASYPWDIFLVMEYLFKRIDKENKGKIEANVSVKGDIIVGENTIIKSGAYIEGPVYIGRDCFIGPNCFIRGCTSIGNNCRIGQAVEIKNCIIGDNTNFSHLSFVGDSIVGSNCNFGAGTIVANLRNDNDTVKTKIKGALIDTGLKKFGTIIGDGVKTGIGTIILPGRKIWPNKATLPGQKVEEDIE